MSDSTDFSYVWVCSCCLFALCNGEGCDCEDDNGGTYASHPHALASLLDGGHAAPDYCPDHGGLECLECGDRDVAARYADDDGYRPFSGSWCDGCGTGLAGDRYRFAWWEDKPKPTKTDITDQA